MIILQYVPCVFVWFRPMGLSEKCNYMEHPWKSRWQLVVLPPSPRQWQIIARHDLDGNGLKENHSRHGQAKLLWDMFSHRKFMSIWHFCHAVGYATFLDMPGCDSCLVPWPDPINIEKQHGWMSRSFQLISIMPVSLCWCADTVKDRLCTLVAFLRKKRTVQARGPAA